MLDLILDGVRMIFSFIDKMVVFVIEYLYQLIIAIADTNVFGNVIYHYLGRIYTFLGIFMVFKLSVSMINYIVNPDALTDKGKGAGKLISNVIISLILLVATPTLFDVAFDIQEDILKTNAVYQIVTGKALAHDSSGNLYKNAETTSKDISSAVFSAFVYKAGDYGQPLCDSSKVNKDDQKICDGTCKVGSTDCLLHTSTVTNDNNTYWWLLSTGVGIFVAYILLTICFDVAMRSVTLGFLQIIAPIPIMLRMDPGAKDDKFMKWLQEVGKNFVSLFIKLASVFFITEIIRLLMKERDTWHMLSSYSGYSPHPLLQKFAELFIIVGCLMFAKKLPQLVGDILGVKLDGEGFSLKKKLSGLPGAGLGKALGAGALGFAGGMAANALAAKKNFGWDKGKGFWQNMGSNLKGGLKSAGSMAAGGISGLGRGAFSKEKSLWKAGAAGVKGAVDKRNMRDEWQATGNHIGKRTLGRINAFAGITDDDTAKIAAKKNMGKKLWDDYSDLKDENGKDIRKGLKYSMGGAIKKEFGKAWERTDKAKDYRNSINKQLSIAKSDFQAGKEVSWNGKTGSAAIAELEVESAKASAAYDKASADFKELRSMREHKTEATYYDAFNYYDDLQSAEQYANKTVSNVSSPNSTQTSSSGNAQQTGKASVDSRSAAYHQTHGDDSGTWE